MEIGDVVGGRYELVELLGRGWSGPVYSARDRETDRAVALRHVDASLASEPGAVTRFLRNAKPTGGLEGAHAGGNLDAGQHEDGSLFLVMEPVAGSSLTDALRSRGRLELGEALEVARQVARALGEAQRAGLAHLCLSPDDVFVEWGASREVRARLLGFCTARLFQSEEEEEPSITHGTAILGVPEYMAPEQARGEAMDDPRSDLYALGVILYEMLAGRLPFEAGSAFAMLVQHLGARAPSFAERAPEAAVPAEVEALVTRLLEKDPAARDCPFEELVGRLDELLAGLGEPARPAQKNQGEGSFGLDDRSLDGDLGPEKEAGR